MSNRQTEVKTNQVCKWEWSEGVNQNKGGHWKKSSKLWGDQLVRIMMKREGNIKVKIIQQEPLWDGGSNKGKH